MTSTALERSLRTIAVALDERSTSWALVGGLAVSVHAEPRLTRDADIVVSVSDDHESEALISSLAGSRYIAVAMVEHEPTGRLATVRLAHPEEPAVVTDLLFASSGIEAEVVADAVVVEVLPGLSLPVAAVGHLIALKLLARDDRARPADADDLRHLAEVAEPREWERALAGVSAIGVRGFARERDLVAALRDLAAEHGVALG